MKLLQTPVKISAIHYRLFFIVSSSTVCKYMYLIVFSLNLLAGRNFLQREGNWLSTDQLVSVQFCNKTCLVASPELVVIHITVRNINYSPEDSQLLCVLEKPVEARPSIRMKHRRNGGGEIDETQLYITVALCIWFPVCCNYK